MAFCVTPKEIYQWLEPQLPSPPVGTRQLVFDVNCTDSADSSQLATLQTAFTVRVRELRYPGRPADAVDAAGKWVYVFRDGKLVVEAHCTKGDSGTAGRWRERRRRDARAMEVGEGLRLDPGPSGHGSPTRTC